MKDETHFSTRPTSIDKEAEDQRKGSGNLGPNYMGYCYLVFEASIALLQTSPHIIDNSSSHAEALFHRQGHYVGVAALNVKTSQEEQINNRRNVFYCIVISLSRDRMPYTREEAFFRLPDDTEWPNIILASKIENKYYRLGVGQVSKYRWDNYAEAEIETIILD